MMMACGHVICKESLQKLSRTNTYDQSVFFSPSTRSDAKWSQYTDHSSIDALSLKVIGSSVHTALQNRLHPMPRMYTFNEEVYSCWLAIEVVAEETMILL